MYLDTKYFAPLELVYSVSDSGSIDIWSLQDRRTHLKIDALVKRTLETPHEQVDEKLTLAMETQR